jgi:hypothetical protein
MQELAVGLVDGGVAAANRSDDTRSGVQPMVDLTGAGDGSHRWRSGDGDKCEDPCAQDPAAVAAESRLVVAAADEATNCCSRRRTEIDLKKNVMKNMCEVQGIMGKRGEP